MSMCVNDVHVIGLKLSSRIVENVNGGDEASPVVVARECCVR